MGTTTLIERLRLLLLLLCVTVAIPFVTAQDGVDDEYVMDDEPVQEKLVVDSALLQYIDSVMAPSLEITSSELNSPMMSVDNVKNVTPSAIERFFDWCVDHMFIASVIVIALIYGLFWVIHKFCSIFI